MGEAPSQECVLITENYKYCISKHYNITVFFTVYCTSWKGLGTKMIPINVMTSPLKIIQNVWQ